MSTLKLYKEILFSCKRFPSRNRNRIYKEIQAEFRENAKLTDKIAINEALQKAQKGLSQLNA
jgi:hypothetical protein